MTYLKISKYDPSNRNHDGYYFRDDEWLDASNIGIGRGGKILTLDDYLAVEDKYVSAAQQFIDILGIKQLTICSLEKRSKCASKFLQSDCDRFTGIVADGNIISSEEFPSYFRMVLRGAFWCRLVGENDFYVSVGHDYWMFLGYEGDNDISDQIVTDLFIEPFIYPFHDREEEDDVEGVDIDELLDEDAEIDEKEEED